MKTVCSFLGPPGIKRFLSFLNAFSASMVCTKTRKNRRLCYGFFCGRRPKIPALFCFVVNM